MSETTRRTNPVAVSSPSVASERNATCLAASTFSSSSDFNKDTPWLVTQTRNRLGEHPLQICRVIPEVGQD